MAAGTGPIPLTPCTPDRFEHLCKLLTGRLTNALDKAADGGLPVNQLQVELTTGDATPAALEELNLALMATLQAVAQAGGLQGQEAATVRHIVDLGLASVATRVLCSSDFDFAWAMDAQQAFTEDGGRCQCMKQVFTLFRYTGSLANPLQHMHPALGRSLYDQLLSGAAAGNANIFFGSSTAGALQLYFKLLASLPSAAGVLPADPAAPDAHTAALMAAAPPHHRRAFVRSLVGMCKLVGSVATHAVVFPHQCLAVLRAAGELDCLGAGVRAAKALTGAGMADEAARLMGHMAAMVSKLQVQASAAGLQGVAPLVRLVNDPALVTALVALMYGLLLRLGSPLRVEHECVHVDRAAFPNDSTVLEHLEITYRGLAGLVKHLSSATEEVALARLDVFLLLLEAHKVMGPQATSVWKLAVRMHAFLSGADCTAALPAIVSALESTTTSMLQVVHLHAEQLLISHIGELATTEAPPVSSGTSPRITRAADGNPFLTRLAGVSAIVNNDLLVNAGGAKDTVMEEASGSGGGAATAPVMKHDADALLGWLTALQDVFKAMAFVKQAPNMPGRATAAPPLGSTEVGLLACTDHTALRCVEAVLRGMPELHVMHVQALRALSTMPEDSPATPRDLEAGRARLHGWAGLANSAALSSVLISAFKFLRVNTARLTAAGVDFGAPAVAAAALGKDLWTHGGSAWGDKVPAAVRLELLLTAATSLGHLIGALWDLETAFGTLPTPPPESLARFPDVFALVGPLLPPLLEAAGAEGLASATAAVRGVRCFLSRQLLVDAQPLLAPALALSRANFSARDLYRMVAGTLAETAAQLAACQLLDQASADAAMRHMSHLLVELYDKGSFLFPLRGTDYGLVMSSAALWTFSAIVAQGLLTTSQVPPADINKLKLHLNIAFMALTQRTSLTLPLPACVHLRHCRAVGGHQLGGLTREGLMIMEFAPRHLPEGTEKFRVCDYWTHMMTRAAQDKEAAGRLGWQPPAAPPAVPHGFSHLPVCSHPACDNLGGNSELLLRLRTCTRCREAQYCGETCQLAHYKAHKAACRAAAELRRAALPAPHGL